MVTSRSRSLFLVSRMTSQSTPVTWTTASILISIIITKTAEMMTTMIGFMTALVELSRRVMTSKTMTVMKTTWHHPRTNAQMSSTKWKRDACTVADRVAKIPVASAATDADSACDERSSKVGQPAPSWVGAWLVRGAATRATRPAGRSGRGNSFRSRSGCHVTRES